MTPLDKYREANRANWDERVPGHWDSDFYDIEGFIKGESPLYQIDIDALGDLTGKSLIHLQCHIGTDTLALARLGAEVTGIDFSGESIKAARRLSEESGVPGRFFETDLYESPKIVNEQFDVVFTGAGAICWLPDIDAWGEVVAGFLKPGGMFYIREGHPLMWALQYDNVKPGEFIMEQPYFHSDEPFGYDDKGSYTDGEWDLKNQRNYNWKHSLSETVMALINAGLVIESLLEHREMDWAPLPGITQDEDRHWRLPEEYQDFVPLEFSIKARKPE